MLPEMGREPGAAGLPDAVIGIVDGSGAAPQIEVMMLHPAARAVVLAGGDGAGGGQIPHGVEELQLALGKVCYSGWPIIHFSVDVVGVLAVPCGSIGIVPEAL